MFLIAQLTFIFFLSFLATALSEVLWHKWLFHRKKDGINKLIVRIWKFDVDTHKEHHLICRERIEDAVDDISTYWVQKPSNVFVAGLIAFLLQACLLLALGFSHQLILFSASFNIILFTFWYQFEDHFHAGMHKKYYYDAHIKNTWQERWFKYCKRLHIIHHRNEKYNFGFIFFPVGDLLLGTYRHTYKSIINKNN